MTTCFTATPGVDVITTTAEIPALGSIAINAFVLHAPSPFSSTPAPWPAPTSSWLRWRR